MKYILIFLSFLSYSVSAQEIHLASDIWQPFTDEEGQKAFALEIVSEALSRAEVQGTTDIVDFGDVLDGIRNKTYDGSAALWHTPDREAFLVYSEPYLTNQLVLVGRKGEPVDVESLNDLQNKKIGTVSNYAYGDLLQEESSNQLIPGASDQENLKKLLDNELDYILVDDLLIHFLLQYQPVEVEQFLEVGTKSVLEKSLHFAIRKDTPNSGQIITGFNQAIQEMKGDGTYNEILELNWISMDVDGDGTLELVSFGNQAGTSAPGSTYQVSGGNGQAQRYYYNGNYYNSFGDIPKEYQVPVSTTNPAGAATLRLNFKNK